jgi:hypothetical protein
MLIGYMRVSKADRSQNANLQRDALVVAGVDPLHLHEDQASGKREDPLVLWPVSRRCAKAICWLCGRLTDSTAIGVI